MIVHGVVCVINIQIQKGFSFFSLNNEEKNHQNMLNEENKSSTHILKKGSSFEKKTCYFF
tara:strand:+ start:911 stop:1090 length:180 start_codon:yes stop_codon:yes gene_type:complete